MTTEEILAELTQAFSEANAPEGYMTTREIARAVGKSTRWVGDKLRDLHDAGRVEYTKVPRFSVDGRMSTVSAYRITPA